jgi:CHAD domain-containing protein
MNPPGSPADPRSGVCWYGLQKLPPLLDAFSREIPGVKEGADIEYIHRMRVASRRLRAALPLFEPCFPEKQYEIWMREITKITRALGEARDMDVQIAFLMKLQKKTTTVPVRGADRNTPKTSSESPAIRFLLADLQRKRFLLQKRVLASLAGLEKSGVTDTMQREFLTRFVALKTVRKRPPLHGIPAIAAFRISRRLSTLLSYDPWVQHPEAVAEHHAARIAAKKLRYTMEIYGSLYRNGLKKPLARVKKIQEILGNIHDCDVWIDHVTQILLHERTLLRSSKRSERPDTQTLASLRIFLRKREAERMQRYHRFVRYWESLSRAGLWTDLLKTLDTGRRNGVLPPLPRSDDDAMATISAITDHTPDVVPHSRHVTMLALMLFDSLRPLHGLAPRDRFLLESAGFLHDIGWYGGRAGHSKRGALLVFTDETLPFDIQERGIISTVIASHRGRVDPVSLPYYPLLLPENQKRALMLAAIFRIADGLDFLHSGSVHNVHCTLISDKVFIEVNGTGDLSAEKDRARIKGDIFSKVFHSRPVLR